MSLELNYKARTVAQAEAKYNQRIKAVMVDFSMGQVGVLTMAFLLEAGGISEDEAYNQIDQVGINGLEVEVTEALLSAGFLRGANEEERKAARAAAVAARAALSPESEGAVL